MESTVRAFTQQGCSSAVLALGADQARPADHTTQVAGITFIMGKSFAGALGKVTLNYLVGAAETEFTYRQ